MSSSVRASVDRKDTPDTHVGDRRPRYSNAAMSRKRTIAIGAGLAAAGAAVRRHRGTRRVPTDPFDPDAFRAETAATRTAELVAQARVRRADLALTFAPAVSTSVDPLLHGRRYFPRILEDIAAATRPRPPAHLRRQGRATSGRRSETLWEKVAAGVEVRLAVDAIGSETDLGSKALFRRLRAAGVEVVAHDGVFVWRERRPRERDVRPRRGGPAQFDHRKMAVVDGAVATSAGAASRTTTTTSASTTSCAG